MKTVVIIRHAKSSWDQPQLRDFERPLAPRGLKQSKDIFQRLRAQLSDVEVILCSSALRTRQTSEILISECQLSAAPFSALDALYMPNPGVILDALRKTDPSVIKVAVVGHEPSLSQFLIELGITPPEKWVTASVSILSFETQQWSLLDAQHLHTCTYHSRYNMDGIELPCKLPSRNENEGTP